MIPPPAFNKLLIDGIDAVIIPHDRIAASSASSIVKIAEENQIPVFSLDDSTVKNHGVALAVSVNYREIGRMLEYSCKLLSIRWIKESIHNIGSGFNSKELSVFEPY